MTQNDADFERDLSDAFAPVRLPETLQQRLLQIPQMQVQRPAGQVIRFVPRSWWIWLAAVSSRPVLGMTTSVAAACCSLVIGLGLGLGGLAPLSASAQKTTTTTAAVSTASSDTDAVSLLYAAADMPGDLP
jgi:hypothetical protein